MADTAKKKRRTLLDLYEALRQAYAEHPDVAVALEVAVTGLAAAEQAKATADSLQRASVEAPLAAVAAAAAAAALMHQNQQAVAEVSLRRLQETGLQAARTVARKASCPQKTAREAWTAGLAGKPALVDVLRGQAAAAVQVEVGAARELMDREKVAASAVQQAGQMVLLSRTSALRAQGVASKLASALVPAAERMTGMIQALLAEPAEVEGAVKGQMVRNPARPTVRSLLGVMTTAAATIRQVNALSIEAAHLEEAFRGTPAEVAQAVADGDMSAEEVDRRLLASHAALDQEDVRRVLSGSKRLRTWRGVKAG